MLDCKPLSTPMVSTSGLSRSDGIPLPDPTLYRAAVGALQYLSLTRPELGFLVNKVCQLMSAHLDTHWEAVKRILRYLKGTIQFGHHLKPASPSSPLSLHWYSDAGWATDLDDRRSTYGAYIFLGPNLITWWSKKQTMVERSSCEAEYISLVQLTAGILWIQTLLQELRVDTDSPLLFCDNSSAISHAHNHLLHARTKHLELDLFFVREKVLSRHLSIQQLPSDLQLADALTNPLPTVRFNTLRFKLNVGDSSQLTHPP